MRVDPPQLDRTPDRSAGAAPIRVIVLIGIFSLLVGGTAFFIRSTDPVEAEFAGPLAIAKKLADQQRYQEAREHLQRAEIDVLRRQIEGRTDAETAADLMRESRAERADFRRKQASLEDDAVNARARLSREADAHQRRITELEDQIRMDVLDKKWRRVEDPWELASLIRQEQTRHPAPSAPFERFMSDRLRLVQTEIDQIERRLTPFRTAIRENRIADARVIRGTLAAGSPAFLTKRIDALWTMVEEVLQSVNATNDPWEQQKRIVEHRRRVDDPLGVVVDLLTELDQAAERELLRWEGRADPTREALLAGRWSEAQREIDRLEQAPAPATLMTRLRVSLATLERVEREIDLPEPAERLLSIRTALSDNHPTIVDLTLRRWEALEVAEIAKWRTRAREIRTVLDQGNVDRVEILLAQDRQNGAPPSHLRQFEDEVRSGQAILQRIDALANLVEIQDLILAELRGHPPAWLASRLRQRLGQVQTQIAAFEDTEREILELINQGQLQEAIDRLEIFEASGAPPAMIARLSSRVPRPPQTPGLEWIHVGEGTYWIGSPPSEPGREDGDLPAMSVRVTEAFFFAKTETTIASFEELLGERDWKKGDEDQCPAHGVSYRDALAYCEAMNAKYSDFRFDLPLESEWEIVARGLTTSASDLLIVPIAEADEIRSREDDFDSLVQYVSAFVHYRKESGETLLPVGSKSPTIPGVYDILGNVAEWTKPDPSLPAPSQFANNMHAPFRGGSYLSRFPRCRPSHRDWLSRSEKPGSIGFRIICRRR